MLAMKKDGAIDADGVDRVIEKDSAPWSEPLRITLGVLTYKRPEGISKLLEVMQNQVHHPDRPYQLAIVVVDNDAQASSRDVVLAYAGNAAYTLHYVVEEVQGIPVARNRALDSASPETRLFCFLDDDEWPVDDWLDSMIQSWSRTDADCIYGPVEPVYEIPPSNWIRDSRLFDRRKFQDGARLDFAASNNVMFDLPRFRALGLRFDQRMQFTGGSDYLFFHQAVRRGIVVRWSEKALVYDVIPANRMTMQWLRQRQYRIGNTLALGTQLDGSRGAKVKRLGDGVARIALGAVLSPAALISAYWGGRSMVHLLRGVGTVVGMLGHAYEEYRPDKLAEAEPKG
jgi:succinoglycan biosynthesis protein ExoM